MCADCRATGGTYTCIIMEPASADDLLQSGIMLAGTHNSAWVGTWNWGTYLGRPHADADYTSTTRALALTQTRAMRRRPQKRKEKNRSEGRQGERLPHWQITG